MLIFVILVVIVHTFIPIHIQRIKRVEQHDFRSSISVMNYKNQQYAGVITLGNQRVQLLFDTGSSVMWVFSKDCTDCKQKEVEYARQQFDCAASANCQKLEQSYEQFQILVSITYGMGFVRGYTAFDSVSVNNYTINSFQFLLVKTSKELGYLQADGVCGLGLDTQDNFKSIIDQLYLGNVIEKRQFSLFLNNMPVEVNNQSILMLGGYDQAYIEEKPQYVQLVDEKNWMVSLKGVQLDKYALNLSGSKTLIDSGSSLIVLPSKDLNNLLQTLRENHKQFCQYSEYQIMCSCPDANLLEFPVISINLDGLTLTLKPEEYITLYLTTCMLGFGKSNEDYWILGDIFLRKYMSVFDIDNKKIGFAETVKFNKLDKQIQINDSLYIFKVLLSCICVAIIMIWLIRKISGLGQASHELL